MDDAKQLLIAEIRGIMAGRNAPDYLDIGWQWAAVKGGSLYRAGSESGTKFPIDGSEIPTSDLAQALATLKQRQVSTAEKRIDRLEARKHADEELIRALEKYKQAVGTD